MLLACLSVAMVLTEGGMSITMTPNSNGRVTEE